MSIDRAAIPGVHACPGCARGGIPNHLYACRDCWARLPGALKRGIVATVDAPWGVRMDALKAAAEFYAGDAPPAGEQTSQCRTCKAPILWRRTDAGAAMPIDPDPRDDGNLDLDDDGRTVHVLADTQPTLDDRPRYVPHFVSCPHAEQHRRSR